MADRTDSRATEYFSTGGGAHPFGGRRAFLSVCCYIRTFYKPFTKLCTACVYMINKNVAGIFVKAVVVVAAAAF